MRLCSRSSGPPSSQVGKFDPRIYQLGPKYPQPPTPTTSPPHTLKKCWPPSLPAGSTSKFSETVQLPDVAESDHTVSLSLRLSLLGCSSCSQGKGQIFVSCLPGCRAFSGLSAPALQAASLGRELPAAPSLLPRSKWTCH